ncbi:hypothetical protein E2562_002613 [Oryza meyeriana var. granulata]|uniref:Glabrous enhancer-binding protein-like DBD domain-containing protein n=1 Tax=Oryza meyeriana var. granulata TaxID=110450 RepID=A0A6G1F2Y2_9ORYZ|nr:hypothetical protein E2562_002613 [Oryza meyeriana var. granulata]
MAPKRFAPFPSSPPPPVASSEETGSGSDSYESEEEETPLPLPAPVVSDKGEEPPQPENREEDDSSDEEESESSESDKAPQLNPAPKQGAEENGPKISSPKRQAFQRIWSTEDEARILEALAAHRREHGALPQIDGLVATLAGSLDKPEYGRKELQVKVNTLKRRYETTAKKAELPSRHDRRLFDLSRSVWGSEAANGAVREFGEMCELYPHLAEEVKALEAAHPGLFKKDFGKLDDDKARALDMKIKKQRIAEITLVLRRGDLTKEVTKVLTELVE